MIKLNNMVYNLKLYIKRNYFKYKLYFSSNPIVVSKDCRGIGLTTIIIRRAIKDNAAILVPTEQIKKNIVHEICKMNQSIYYANNHVITYNDLKIFFTRFLKENIVSCVYILADNSCRKEDIIKLNEICNAVSIYKLRGFISESE